MLKTILDQLKFVNYVHYVVVDIKDIYFSLLITLRYITKIRTTIKWEGREIL